MIAYLKGKIKYQTPNWLILDVGGVGYKIYVKAQMSPLSADPRVAEKIKIGDEADFYIYHHIREDRNELYGFLTIEELNIFELLLEVNGVGPKMAMNILSGAAIEKIKNAIISGDAVFFTSISGVGKKLAGKIILELKNKLGDGGYDALQNTESYSELIDAMISLGYKKHEIYKLISQLPDNLKTTQEKIKWMLKGKL